MAWQLLHLVGYGYKYKWLEAMHANQQLAEASAAAAKLEAEALRGRSLLSCYHINADGGGGHFWDTTEKQ